MEAVGGGLHDAIEAMATAGTCLQLACLKREPGSHNNCHEKQHAICAS
jgi:hypothetical protein